jgi:hypothetical protein
MPEIRTFGLMSGEGKRGIAIAPVLASTQPTRRREWQRKRVKSAGQATLALRPRRCPCYSERDGYLFLGSNLGV